MSIFSWQFLLFTAGALLLYYLLPRKGQWAVLLCLSLGFFYAFGALAVLGALCALAAVTFGAGLLLDRLNAGADERKARGKKRLVLTLCLLLSFGLLFGVRYWDPTAGAQKGAELSLPVNALLLPLAMSFCTLQSVGYVIDCFRGKYPAQRDPLKYLLFVSFFPQTIQGPISRWDELAPQLLKTHRWDPDSVKYGIQLALWGCLKKLLLADRAAPVVRAVFGAPERWGGFAYGLAVLFYCIQLYCEFSGGVDLTRGVAQMFGIQLAESVRRPIFADSLADYWRRWLITLGTWMRDYVYEPMVGSKAGAALGRRIGGRFGEAAGRRFSAACAALAVGLLVGLWHGTSLRFLFFGCYHGAILAASVLLTERFSRWRKGLGLRDGQPFLRVLRLLRTLCIVFVGRYLTRAPRLLTAFSMLKKTVLHPCFYQLKDGTLAGFGLTGLDYAVVGLGVTALLLLEWRQEKGVEIRKDLERRSAFVQWLAIFLPLLALSLHLMLWPI